MSQKIEQINLSISRTSIIKLVLIGSLLGLAIYLKYLLVTLIIAFILASFAKYFTNLIKQKYDISYNTGITIIFIGLLGIVLTSIALLLPVIIKESYGLFETVTSSLQRFESQLILLGIPTGTGGLKQFASLIPNLGQVTINLISVFGQILTYGLLILVLAFYMAIDKTGVNTLVRLCVPLHIRDDVPNIVKRLQYHIGKWAFKEGAIALIMGIFMYTILGVLGVQYAVLLALLTSISQLIPVIGPIIIMTSIIIYAFAQSPILGVLIIILIVFIQFIKQKLLLPAVFDVVNKTNTLVIVFALTIGGVFAGPLGILIAMPFVSLASIVYDDIQHYD